jgi:hypothetical protein
MVPPFSLLLGNEPGGLLSKHPHLTPYQVKTVLRAVAGHMVAPGAADDR